MVGLEEPEVISLPEKQQLVERLGNSLNFAKRAIQHLIIEGHAAPQNAPWYVRQEKIIAETAFLMVFANSCKAYKPVAEALNELAKALEPLSRSEAMLLNICLKPDLALDYAHSHICLNYLGYPNKKFDKALADALASEAAKGIERTPYRVLEREWLQCIWDNKHSGEGFRFWIPLSCLYFPGDLFSESSDGVYALTHAIMYAAHGGSEIPDVDIDKLLNRVEALLVRYVDNQDYDVAGELLIAWPLLGKQLSPAAAFALNCLLDIEARVGFLPAPGLDRSMIEGKEQNARRTYIYGINYHTSLVMGLLCSSLLEHYNYLDANNDTIICDSELSNLLESQLKKGKQVHWNEYYTKLDNKQKQLLIPWIYQAILARNIVDRKYSVVKNMLKLSKGSALETLEMSRQSEELLQRLGRNVA